MTDSDAQRISRPDGSSLAYYRVPADKTIFKGRGTKRRGAKRRGSGDAGVVFLGGFMSDMTGTKATALEAAMRASGRGFLRFDYGGHGESSGKFEEGTIGSWAQDAIFALDNLTEGPQVLVGSSMGGWIMLLVALARPERVAGLVGIASAPDFTEKLMWANFPPEARRAILEEGIYYEPSDYDDGPYPITRALIEEGRKHLLLDAPIPIEVPVRLLHGMEDEAVPWEISCQLMARLASKDVTLTLVKGGDHRLSGEPDLARLAETIETFCAEVGG